MVWDPKETLDSLGIGETQDGRKRSVRVGEAIREELATLLLSKVRDPKLREVSVTRVEVTGDLSLARVFVTVSQGRSKAGSAMKGLERAKGFLRSAIAKALNLRFTPALEFRYDEVVEKVAELDDIFQEIADERRSRDNDS